jgi:hypothetical protein
MFGGRKNRQHGRASSVLGGEGRQGRALTFLDTPDLPNVISLRYAIRANTLDLQARCVPRWKYEHIRNWVGCDFVALMECTKHVMAWEGRVCAQAHLNFGIQRTLSRAYTILTCTRLMRTPLRVVDVLPQFSRVCWLALGAKCEGKASHWPWPHP